MIGRLYLTEKENATLVEDIEIIEEEERMFALIGKVLYRRALHIKTIYSVGELERFIGIKKCLGLDLDTRQLRITSLRVVLGKLGSTTWFSRILTYNLDLRFITYSGIYPSESRLVLINYTINVFYDAISR